jgi:hypothetical protein
MTHNTERAFSEGSFVVFSIEKTAKNGAAPALCWPPVDTL